MVALLRKDIVCRKCTGWATPTKRRDSGGPDDAPRVAHLEGLRAGDGFIYASLLWRALAWFRRPGIPWLPLL